MRMFETFYSLRSIAFFNWFAAVCVCLFATSHFPCLPSHAAETSDPPALSEAPLTAEDRQHWAFRPRQRTAPPDVKDPAWARTPVDRFVLARLDQAGLRPAPPADKSALIRRITFDLTGLPPTPDEIRAFLNDAAPDAYERLIDRLLASPAYGERWASHWLDLARFAETDGFEHDFVRPNAWRYRDWVIEALNTDLPFDEFVRQQLAGDELAPDDPAAAIATGFLLCGPDMPDLNLQQERRHNVLNEMTATVGSVFLGLQLGCAQCHDHKYDPLSQADFYRLRAFFDGAAIFKDHPIPSPAELQQYNAAETARGPAAKVLELQIREIEDAARTRLREKNPDLQPTSSQVLAAFSEQESKIRADLLAQRARTGKLPTLPLGRVVREGQPQPSHLMIRGDFRRPGAAVTAAFPRIADGTREVPPAVPDDQRISGHRTELARWLTRPDHPLTTRVIVNRLWQFHFGEGLVRSASDFGRMGDEPSHPELLDWLATELPLQGWSLKRMHRLLLRSATYRQASRLDSSDPIGGRADATSAGWKRSLQIDPDNRLLSRRNRRRLDGEEIRDAMLAVSDSLNSRRGGPGVRPPVPTELVSTLLKDQWTVSLDPEDYRRRSIYLFVRRNLRYPLFEAFDRPDTNASCPQRNVSTIAPQALMLLNSELSLAAARDLCSYLYRQADASADARAELAFLRTLGRTPTRDEQQFARAFLSVQVARLKAQARPAAGLALPETLPEGADPDAAAALTGLCLSLFNLNEFVYVD